MSLNRLNQLRRSIFAEEEKSEAKATVDGRENGCSYAVEKGFEDPEIGPALRLNLSAVRAVGDEMIAPQYGRNASDPDRHFSTLLECIYNKSDEAKEAGSPKPILIKSVGEVHRQYRERGKTQQPRQPQRSQSSTNRPAQRPPFVCGGKLKDKETETESQQSIGSPTLHQRGLLNQAPVYEEGDGNYSMLGEDSEYSNAAATVSVVVIGDLCYSSFCTNFELRQAVEVQCRKCLSEGRSLLLQTELLDPDSHREGQIVLKTLFMAISHLTTSTDGIFPVIHQREDHISGLCRLEMQVEPLRH